VRRLEDAVSSSAFATPGEALLDALRSATSYDRSGGVTSRMQRCAC
jgi:hypothetical protein